VVFGISFWLAVGSTPSIAKDRQGADAIALAMKCSTSGVIRCRGTTILGRRPDPSPKYKLYFGNAPAGTFEHDPKKWTLFFEKIMLKQ